MGRPVDNDKHVPRALQGMNLAMSHKENYSVRMNSYNEARKRLYADDDDEVDAVKTSTGGFGGVRAGTYGADDDSSSSEGHGGKTKWSERYSITPHLRAMTGGRMASSTDILQAMDQQHKPNKSATNMYRSSAYNMDGIGGKSGDIRFYGQRQSSPNIHSAVLSDNPLWMDVDLRGRSSLPPPPHSRPRGGFILEKHKDKVTKRCLVYALVATAALAGIFAVVLTHDFSAHGDGGNLSTLFDPPGTRFSFYATSNVPFTEESGKELSRGLSDIPTDSFLVHLGDVGLADETFCDEDTYADASTILESCPAPVFVLPGNNDWNDCPDPDAAWENWDNYFGNFQEHFPENFDVGRQLGRSENFVFLHEGVLFLGVNLVNGRVHDRSEWNKRHAQNLLWIEQNLRLHDYNDFRAVVIFGHSPPYELVKDFFSPAVKDLKKYEKPVLYLHANNDGGFQEYKPFGNGEPELLAVEVNSWGGDESSFVKVTIDFGSSPFIFDQVESST